MWLNYTLHLYKISNKLINFRTISERRQILLENMIEIHGYIMFSEVKELHVSKFKNEINKLYLIRNKNLFIYFFQKTKDLMLMVETVLNEGLEGLVLKDLSVKKIYLFKSEFRI